MDCIVHGILYARILEWVDLDFAFSRRSSQPRDQTQLSHKGSPRILEWVAYLFSRGSFPPRNQNRVSCIAGRFVASWATREAQAPSWRTAKHVSILQTLRSPAWSNLCGKTIQDREPSAQGQGLRFYKQRSIPQLPSWAFCRRSNNLMCTESWLLQGERKPSAWKLAIPQPLTPEPFHRVSSIGDWPAGCLPFALPAGETGQMELRTALPTVPACLPGTSWMQLRGNEASTSQQADMLKNINTLKKSLDSEMNCPPALAG